MKKLFAFTVMLLFIASSFAVFAAVPGFTIPKVEKAPVLDGIISDGEYGLVAEDGFTYQGDGAKDIPAKIYAAYDSTNVYFAFVVGCKEHIATIEGDNYIFSQHNIMVDLTPTDPSLDIYKPAGGATEWEWGAAAGSGLGREFGLAVRSTDGTLASSIWFKPLAADYSGDWSTDTVPQGSYTVVHTGDNDIYEVAVPWDFLDPVGENTRTVGSKFGFAVCMGAGDDYNGKGKFILYADGVNTYKNFADFAIITLGDVLVTKPASADTSANDAPAPGTAEEAAQTGDISIILSVVLLFAAFAAIERVRAK